jgi:uncharacterized OB-fold protein
MSSQESSRDIPAPLVNPEAQAFFSAALEKRLIYKHCDTCDTPHHPPRSMCPHCHSCQTQWKVSTGKGMVFCASMLRKGVPVPYCIAYVTLDEGVTMMSDLIGFCDVTPPVGTRVQVKFITADGGAQVPMFEPVQTL